MAKFKKQTQELDVFLYTYLAIAEVADRTAYEEAFAKKKKENGLTLQDVIGDDHWEINKSLLDVAAQLYLYRESRTFASIFKDNCKPGISVMEVISIADQSIQQFTDHIKFLFAAKTSEITLASIIPIWGGIQGSITSIINY